MSAINYYDSCIVLKNHVLENYNPSIIYPLIYLERHTLELLLKSLILSDVDDQKITNQLKINILGSKFDLSRTHSLETFFDKYYSIQTQARLLQKLMRKLVNIKK